MVRKCHIKRIVQKCKETKREKRREKIQEMKVKFAVESKKRYMKRGEVQSQHRKSRWREKGGEPRPRQIQEAIQARRKGNGRLS